jgi:hypothetical protein
VVDEENMLIMNCRSLVLALVLIFGCSELVFGQVQVGLSYGNATSSMKYIPRAGRPAERTPGISTPTYSFFIEHFANKNAGARLEFQKLMMGYTQSDTLGRTNQSQFEYLKIPLMANFQMGNSGKFHVKLGTHVGYMLSVEDTQRDFEGLALLPTYGGPEDNPSRLLYGILAGVGVSKSWGAHTIAGDARYSYDFNRIEQKERIFDMNTSLLEFSVSYIVRISKGKWQKIQ